MNASIHAIQRREPGLTEILAIARYYCDLIDAAGADRVGWLVEVAKLLPRLHAAMNSLDVAAAAGEVDHPVNLDARFELFSHLRDLLGDRDGYFLEFDRHHEGGESMTGSLADDLTDIYCELKHELRAFDQAPNRPPGTWFLGYEGHWAQHLTDAERHIAHLAATNRLK